MSAGSRQSNSPRGRPSGGYRRMQILMVLLLVWIWAFSFLRWPELPDRIPVHFNFSGEPDRWVQTTWLRWFAMPLTALAMTVVLTGVGLASIRYPRYINMPGKRELLGLPPEEQKPILGMVPGLMYRIVSLLNVQWLLVQVGTYQVAMGLSKVLPWWVRVSMIAVVPLVLLVTASTLARMRSMTRDRAGALANGRTADAR